MPAVETFKNVPELFEGSFEESIKTRTETMSTFKQLGPDDLVHVVKDIPNSRQQIKEVSSYHFVVGVDTSSSASIAAYINSLTYSLESHQKWLFTHRPNSWNISKCTFCAFNAFTGTDVRVEARIPGGVKSFVVDVMGGRRGTDSEIWQETYLSSILRSLKDADDNVHARRILDSQFNLQAEMKFLEAASKLFHKGRQLGTPHGPHLAGNHDNFLTLGVVGYFCGTGRPEISIGFLKQFIDKDASLGGLMMKCLLQANNQGSAIRMLKDDHVPSGEVADFLVSRGDFVKAEHFASESLKQSPSSFENWQRIVKIKIALGQPEKALIVLNNAPVCAYPESVFYKQLPKPALVSLPGTDAEASDQQPSASLLILEKLKSTGLKGNFLDAYNLLIEIYRNIGWDSLLECRSRVFVMEREYYTNEVTNDTMGTKDNKVHDKDIVTEGTQDIKSPQSDPVSFVTLPTPNFLHSTGKKLCERWLDNLILILFEDLRIFAHFCEELKKIKAVKSGREWLLLGKLSIRLHQPEEAKLALQKCLFNPQDSSSSNTFNSLKTQQSALNALIAVYCSEGKAHLALLCTLKLLNCNELVYVSAMHPSSMSSNLCKLIGRLGIDRVYRDLRSIKKDQQGDSNIMGGCEKIQEFLDAMKDAKIHGYDY